MWLIHCDIITGFLFFSLFLICFGLTVNVDDAMDDIVRQFKGVSDGLMRKVVGSSSISYEPASPLSGSNLSSSADEINRLVLRQNTADSANSFSDYEEADNDGRHGCEEIGSSSQANGWHSDNELNSKGFPPRVLKLDDEFRSTDSAKHGSQVQSRSLSLPNDSIGVPPEVLCIQYFTPELC